MFQQNESWVGGTIENHAFVITFDVSNARFFTFTLKHVAMPVEFWNQINATSVQIKHCQLKKLFLR